MPRLLNRILCTAILLSGLCSYAPAQVPAKQRMVVLISLDGFPGYALDDPKLPIPTLRKLIARGAVARMTPVNPTVTWPNHTSMVTGVRADKHGLLANGMITPTGKWPPYRVDPTIDKEKLVRVPTVYDAAHKAGLTTAQVNWVAINHAPGITWAFSEWAAADGPLEQEMIRKGALSAADFDTFSKRSIVFRDQIWTTAAAYLIREHRPNLLLFHLLSLDSTHHQYGPNTLAGTAAIAFLDAQVGRVVDAVHAAGMSSRTTFIVVSDHGFKAYTKQIKPTVALESAGLGKSVWVMPEGGTAFVYFDRSRAAELEPKVKRALAGVEGIDRILSPAEFPALGLPVGAKDPQVFQLLLTAKTGYGFSGATGGPVTAEVPQQRGSHGYVSSDPEMDAIFIASGFGVRAGNRPGRVANIDLASTIAKLLGVSLPSSDGKPISLQ